MRWLAILATTVTVAVAGCQPQVARDAQPGARVGVPAQHPAEGADPYGVLIEAVRSGQPPIQSLAAETFLESDRLLSREDLLVLAQAPDVRVRTMGLALGGASRQREFLEVARRAVRDPQEVVRVSAAFAMAMCGDASQVTALRDGLLSPDVTVRRTSVWLLGLMGNPSAVGLLRVKLGDPDAVVVLRAAEAMGRLGSSDGLERVRAMTEHPRHPIRVFAVRLLGRLGETGDIPRLERLYQSRFLDVRFAAVASLARLGDWKRISLLVEFLDSEEAELRLVAARELAETGYRPALERLGKHLGAADPMERATIAAAMVRIQSAGETWRSRILADERPPSLDADRPAVIPRTTP